MREDVQEEEDTAQLCFAIIEFAPRLPRLNFFDAAFTFEGEANGRRRALLNLRRLFPRRVPRSRLKRRRLFRCSRLLEDALRQRARL